MSKFERLYDRFDAQKWAHPELAERYEALMAAGTATIDSIYNYDIPFEERKAAVAVQAAGMRELLGTGKETGNPAIDPPSPNPTSSTCCSQLPAAEWSCA